MLWLARQRLFMYRVLRRTRTLLEVQLMADCESRLVAAGLRHGFQYNVALSGNDNWTFSESLFLGEVLFIESVKNENE